MVTLSKASQGGEDDELDARVEELEEAGEEAADAAREHPHDQREADSDGLERHIIYDGRNCLGPPSLLVIFYGRHISLLCSLELFSDEWRDEE